MAVLWLRREGGYGIHTPSPSLSPPSFDDVVLKTGPVGWVGGLCCGFYVWKNRGGVEVGVGVWGGGGGV